jgi:hypothetical protein
MRKGHSLVGVFCPSLGPVHEAIAGSSSQASQIAGYGLYVGPLARSREISIVEAYSAAYSSQRTD